METTRQQKISRMLQKELSEIFMLYAKKHQGILVSVTTVRISPDLSICHVNLSIFPGNKTKEMLKLIETDNKSIRFELGKRVKNQMRIIPDLHFHLDDSLDYIENIDNLLKSDPPKPLSEDTSIE